MPTLLEYEKEILQNINQEACMSILAKGLRHIKLILSILRLYCSETI